MKTAITIFQRAMENVLTNEVSNMIIYQDDICLGTNNNDELRQKQDMYETKHVGMTINRDKCEFDSYRIS